MPETRKPDFSGWVTKNDLLCSDGRIIRSDAFAHQDGQKVPGCWNHQHDNPNSVWGHVILHSVDGGVRGDAYVNDTDSGRQAKALVRNGDITNFSIYANRVKQRGKDVMHGTITEVSLVFAGANPGAKIDDILEHSDSDGMSIIFYGEDEDTLFFHADEDMNAQAYAQQPQQVQQPQQPMQYEQGGTQPMSINDAIRSMNDQQKLAVLQLIDMAIDKGAQNVSQQASAAIQHSLANQAVLMSALEYKNAQDYYIAHADEGIGFKPSGQNFTAAQNRIAVAQGKQNVGNTVGDIIENLSPEKAKVAQLIADFAATPEAQKDPSVFADPQVASVMQSFTTEETQAVLAGIGYMMQNK